MFLFNYKKSTNIIYLLSNKLLTEIIIMDLNFKDDEFTEYYINFIKTVASKLNEHPADLFYNSRNMQFPLLYTATRFFNHHETLVRTTVQNIVLGVLKLEDKK